MPSSPSIHRQGHCGSPHRQNLEFVDLLNITRCRLPARTGGSDHQHYFVRVTDLVRERRMIDLDVGAIRFGIREFNPLA
jgi:hypothetical protein